MARAKTDKDRATAERIAKGKDPEKALKRAFPDRDPAEVLWKWLAEGLLPLNATIGRLAGATAEDAPVDAVVATVAHVPRHPLRSEWMTWCVSQSYQKRPAEWEARLDTLPHAVQLLLLWPRHRARMPISERLRDEAASIYADAAVDGDHDHASQLTGMAVCIGRTEADFARQIVARLESDPPSRVPERWDLVDALVVAPWPLVTRVLATWSDRAMIHRTLERRCDAFHDVKRLLDERGLAADPDFAALLASRAAAQGQTVSEALDPALVARFAAGDGDARTMALIERLPAARFEAFAAAVRATGTRELCCLGLLRDPARDAEVEAALWQRIVGGVAADDYRDVLRDAASDLRAIAAAGSHGYALLERVLAEARALEARFGDRLAFAVYPSQVRFQLRRAMFLATAGAETRPLELLQPGEDLPWVEDLVDVLGPHGNGWEVLADLTADERARVLTPWARLSWDGTLDTRDPASQAHAPPPIEESSWTELAAAIEQTSPRRFAVGEREHHAVTRALRRAPSDAERVALVDRVLERVTSWSVPVLRGLMPLVTAVLPLWTAEARPLEGTREKVAYALLRAGADGDLRARLLELPRTQVDAWRASMAKDPAPAVQRRARGLA